MILLDWELGSSACSHRTEIQQELTAWLNSVVDHVQKHVQQKQCHEVTETSCVCTYMQSTLASFEHLQFALSLACLSPEGCHAHEMAYTT